MSDYFKKAFYIQLWMPVVFLGYLLKMFSGDIYSNGEILLAILVSIISILGVSLFVSNIYEIIEDDVVSEVSQSTRFSSLAIKSHVGILVFLGMIYFLCLNMNAQLAG